MKKIYSLCLGSQLDFLLMHAEYRTHIILQPEVLQAFVASRVTQYRRLPTILYTEKETTPWKFEYMILRRKCYSLISQNFVGP